MYNATKGLKSPFSHVRLTKDLKEDLKMWWEFLSNFNGHSLWQHKFIEADALQLFTDTAGSCGYGLFFYNNWSADSWPLLELFPVLVALEIWGCYFANRRIMLRSDHKGVIYDINCFFAKLEPVVTLLRRLVLVCLKWNVWLKARHLEGQKNIIADSLSHCQISKFLELVPEVDLNETPYTTYL